MTTLRNNSAEWICALVATLFLAACDSPEAQKPITDTAATDQAGVKYLHDQIVSIEDAVTADQKAFLDAVGVTIQHTHAGKALAGKKMQESLQHMIGVLQRSTEIRIPTINDPDANRYATAMVDDHKQWALLRQAQVAAIVQGDMELTDSIRVKSDAMAEQEAMHIVMAYHAVHLTVE